MLADRISGRLVKAERRYSIDTWIQDYLIPSTFGFNGSQYPYGLNTTYSRGAVTEIANTLPGWLTAMRACPPAFAAQMVRALVLSQARFTFRSRRQSRKVFGTSALGLLERPWTNATTGELIARMEWHAGLTGNAYVRRERNRLRVLRPDWVVIVYGSEQEPEDAAHALDGELIGYAYANGGIMASGYGEVAGLKNRVHTLLPTEVAHWSPIPDPEGAGVGQAWFGPAIQDVMADRAATEHKIQFFKQGATPNLVVKGIPATTKTQFDELVEMMESRHAGLANAYKTLYLTVGADATVVGSNFRDMDLKNIQGASETRISFLSRVPAPLLMISEGMAGSSLNAGNFGMARRTFADLWVYPSLQDLAAAVAPLVRVPDDAEMWFDVGDIPLLREDGKDAADIQQTLAATITMYVREGFTAESSVAAAVGQDPTLLKHTGLTSVQLQKPGMNPDDPDAPDDDTAALIEAMGAVSRSDVGPKGELRRYNPSQARVPKGFEGGGRFRSLSQRLTAILKDWIDGDGDGDPFAEFDKLEPDAAKRRERYRKAAVARGIKLRRGASEDEIKEALKADLRKGGEKIDSGPAAPADNTDPPAGPVKAKKVTVTQLKPGDRILVRQHTDGEWVPSLRPGTGKPVTVRRLDTVPELGSTIREIVATDEDGNELFVLSSPPSTRVKGDDHRIHTYSDIYVLSDAPEPKKRAPAKKAAPAAYELAPGLKGPTARARHKARDEVLVAIHESGEAPRGLAHVEAADALESMGYIESDGKGWRLTDKGRAYIDAKANKPDDAAPAKKAAPKTDVGQENLTAKAPSARETALRQRLSRLADEARPLVDFHARILELRNPRDNELIEDQRAVERLRKLRIEGAELAKELLGELIDRDGVPFGGDADADAGRWRDAGHGAASFEPVGDSDFEELAKLRDRYVVSDKNTITQNASLRSGDPSPAAKSWASRMSRLVRSARLTHDTKLYRAAALRPDQVMELRPGAVLRDRGIVSTGREMSDAGSYLRIRTDRQPDSIGVMFEIRTPAGTPAKDVGYGEVVLDRDNRFRVVSSRILDDGTVHVTMELTDDTGGRRVPGGTPDVGAGRPSGGTTGGSGAGGAGGGPAHTVADLRKLAKLRGISPIPRTKAELLKALGLERSRDFVVEYLAQRAAGKDITPGHDELHHYWTRGEGLAKWKSSPHPWTTLVAHLTKHVGPAKAKVFASRWFHEVFGYYSGSDLHRVHSGKPPRGKRIGPG